MSGRPSKLVFVCLVCILFAACHSGDSLRDGDRIVFFGDSITQLGVNPGGYVTLVDQAIGLTGKDIEVIGAGISGHKVPDLQERLERDVLSRDPTIVFVYIGINDVWHWELAKTRDHLRGTTPEDFKSGLLDIIGRMQDYDIRVILCTPTIVGEQKGGVNQLDPMLDRYADISRKVAQSAEIQLLDLRKAFVNYLETNNTEDAHQHILTYDGVHLNDRGNQFLASLILESLGVSQTERGRE